MEEKPKPKVPMPGSCLDNPISRSLRGDLGSSYRRGGQGLIRTKLVCQDSQTGGDQLLGELVSVISHLGGADGGHWISYHQVHGNWFINNHSDSIVRSPYHPFDSPNMFETVNLCLFSSM